MLLRVAPSSDNWYDEYLAPRRHPYHHLHRQHQHQQPQTSPSSLLEDLVFSPSLVFGDEDGVFRRQQQHQQPRFEVYPACTYRLRLRPSAEGEVGPARPSFTRQRSGLSKITSDDQEFKICLDVQQFKPDEVSVKTVDEFVVVEGKHEEKEDEHGFVQRHFVRRYRLPENVRPDTVQCSMSSDGVLAITAPRQKAPEPKERVVPITRTSAPAVKSGTEGVSGAEGGDEPRGKAGTGTDERVGGKDKEVEQPQQGQGQGEQVPVAAEP